MKVYYYLCHATERDDIDSAMFLPWTARHRGSAHQLTSCKAAISALTFDGLRAPALLPEIL